MVGERMVECGREAGRWLVRTGQCWLHVYWRRGEDVFVFSIISMILAVIFCGWFSVVFFYAIFSNNLENLERAKYALIIMIPMGLWLATSVCLYFAA